MAEAFVTMLFEDPADTFRIPNHFAISRFGDVAPANPILIIFNDGTYWHVNVERVGDQFFFTQGWQQVVEQIPLRRNYYLEFNFEDNTTAFLDVSDPNGAAILGIGQPANVLNAPPAMNLNPVSDDESEDLLSFADVVTVRTHFRLPSRLAELAGFYDGMKIRVVYENERGRTFKLRGQSNMITYRRYTIHGWKTFAKRHGIVVGQLIRLTYDFEKNVLFVDEVD